MISTIQPHNTILSFLNKHINPHICKYINPYKYMWTIINKIYIKKNGLTPLTIDKVVSETKKSDTIFFFGSGFSVNEISNEEWDYFKSHNTISANWFHKRDIIPIDFLVNPFSFSIFFIVNSPFIFKTNSADNIAEYKFTEEPSIFNTFFNFS